MKATITIEIEGDEEEIESITKKLQRFVGRQPTKVNMIPRRGNVFPLKNKTTSRW